MTKCISCEELNDKSNYLFAEENDICYEINDTLCLCNVENQCFNIGIESLKPKCTTPRDALRFIYLLYIEHEIDYISIREHTIWPILQRFKYYKENNVYYFKISENLNQLYKESKIYEDKITK